MSYLDTKHQKLIKQMESLWNSLKNLSKFGNQYGIDDILQDNGAKVLQQLILLNFKNIKNREGNDAIDSLGIEWEMKSANIKKVSGFSTHHHLNDKILQKYRSVPWSFAIYKHIELQSIYVMNSQKLEPLFQKWENQLNRMKNKLKEKSINNPKIPIRFVYINGYLVYPFKKKSIDPLEISKKYYNSSSI